MGVARVHGAQGECPHHGTGVPTTERRVGGRSGLAASSLSLCVCVCPCVFQSTPTLLALMGLRCEGLVPAIVLPLLLTMVTLIYTQNPSATPGATG